MNGNWRSRDNSSTKTVPEAAKEGPFIFTRSGPFNFFTGDLSGIDIFDIAFSLAATVRYRGLMGTYYSVAEHSVRGSHLVASRMFRDDVAEADSDPDRMAILFLLHDAPEAYVGDIPSPLKRHFQVVNIHSSVWQAGVQELENSINRRIHELLDLELPTPEEKQLIRRIDEAMFQVEFAEFFGVEALQEVMESGYGAGELNHDNLRGVSSRCHRLGDARFYRSWGWSVELAEIAWVDRFTALQSRK